MREIVHTNFKEFNAISNFNDIYNEVFNMEEEAVLIDQNAVVDDEFGALALPLSENMDINVFGEDDGNGEGRRRNVNQEALELNRTRLPELCNETDMFAKIRNLNVKQRQYFAHVMHNLQTQKVFYEFVGGGAGVGKSTLISALFQAISYRENKLPGADFQSLKALLCAYTGKAAFNIGGVTLHNVFSLPISGTLLPLSASNVNRIHTQLKDLRLIIIDEISMVGAKMLSNIDSRLQQIFKTNLGFGGIPIIAFGDLKQLCPVIDAKIFGVSRAVNYAQLTGPILWRKFEFFELTEIMRQMGDLAFAIALRNMSTGQMTPSDINLMKSRIVNSVDVPDMAIRLYFKNEDAERYNFQRLLQITTPAFCSTAVDVLKSNIPSEATKLRILNSVRSVKASAAQGLLYPF